MRHGQPDPTLPKVHIVDDNRLVLESITATVEAAGFTAIPHLDVGSFLARLTPDECACVLLDLRLPGVQGMSLLRELNANHPGLPVIMISGHADIASAMEALRCGALDFLVKPFRREELLDRLGKAVTLAKAEFLNRARAREIQARIDALTPRELEVMGLLRQGKSVKRIGFELGVSPKTIQVHRTRVMDTMGVDSVVKLTNLLHEFDSLRAPFRHLSTTTEHGFPRHGAGDDPAGFPHDSHQGPS